MHPPYNILTVIKMEPIPASQKRCSAAGCKKKLQLTALACRCGPRFCDTHRLPEAHDCTYDHHAAAVNILKVQLGGPIAPDKVEGRI